MSTLSWLKLFVFSLIALCLSLANFALAAPHLTRRIGICDCYVLIGIVDKILIPENSSLKCANLNGLDRAIISIKGRIIAQLLRHFNSILRLRSKHFTKHVNCFCATAKTLKQASMLYKCEMKWCSFIKVVFSNILLKYFFIGEGICPCFLDDGIVMATVLYNYRAGG